jgi:hypothetical protein
LLQQDPRANAPLIAKRLQPLGYDGGITMVIDYLSAARQNSKARCAHVRVEPAAGERFVIDWGHFGTLIYNGARMRTKIWPPCLAGVRRICVRPSRCATRSHEMCRSLRPA